VLIAVDVFLFFLQGHCWAGGGENIEPPVHAFEFDLRVQWHRWFGQQLSVLKQLRVGLWLGCGLKGGTAVGVCMEGGERRMVKEGEWGRKKSK
jgi:hypothetical protein